MAKRHRIELNWVKLRCDRCGGERLAKRPCPECGARPAPHETQPDLDRRRRLLSEFRAGRRPVTPGVRPDDVGAALEATLDQVQAALAAVSRKGQDATPLILIQSFEVLDQFEASMSISLPRPHLNAGRRMHRATTRGPRRL